MHEILAVTDREVTANRSGRGVLGVRGTHETSHDLPRVFRTLDDEHQGRALRDEFDELVVVRLTVVFGVVTLGRREVDRAQFGRDEVQLLGFESAEDRADETALDAVGLHDEERSIHDEAI